MQCNSLLIGRNGYVVRNILYIWSPTNYLKRPIYQWFPYKYLSPGSRIDTSPLYLTVWARFTTWERQFPLISKLSQRVPAVASASVETIASVCCHNYLLQCELFDTQLICVPLTLRLTHPPHTLPSTVYNTSERQRSEAWRVQVEEFRSYFQWWQPG